MVPKGKFDWYTPDKTMKPEAREVFNTLPALKSLPNIPTALMELQTLIENENVNSKQLALAAKKDPIVAANIIRVANNFKFTDRTSRIESLDHAISYIGRGSMRDIVTTAAIQSFVTRCQAFSLERFWERALLCGRIAERLASEFASHIPADNAYIAGCLCNIGKVVLAITFPEVADDIARKEEAPTLRPWIKSEAALTTPGHAILGEIGASLWGMPEFVAIASSNHHKIPSVNQAHPINYGELAGFANQLAHWLDLEPIKIDRSLMFALAKKFGFAGERPLEEYVDKVFYLRETK